MAEIVFSYNQNSTMIQFKKDEKMIYIFSINMLPKSISNFQVFIFYMEEIELIHY